MDKLTQMMRRLASLSSWAWRRLFSRRPRWQESGISIDSVIDWQTFEVEFPGQEETHSLQLDPCVLAELQPKDAGQKVGSIDGCYIVPIWNGMSGIFGHGLITLDTTGSLLVATHERGR